MPSTDLKNLAALGNSVFWLKHDIDRWIEVASQREPRLLVGGYGVPIYGAAINRAKEMSKFLGDVIDDIELLEERHA